MRKSVATPLAMLPVSVAVMAHSATMALATPGAISGLTSPKLLDRELLVLLESCRRHRRLRLPLRRSPGTSGGTTVALSALGFSRSQFTTGSSPRQVVSGDFGNGRLDLAVLDEGADSVTVLLGNGHGGFTTGNTYTAGDHRQRPGRLAEPPRHRDAHPERLGLGHGRRPGRHLVQPRRRALHGGHLGHRGQRCSHPGVTTPGTLPATSRRRTRRRSR